MCNECVNLLILGSGGCTLTPRPGCQCAVCEEAREEGIPYARSGPSLFLEDINVLFDTPEDISHQLNRENIQEVDYIFYTHWHPDHTAGMRIVEQMNLYFLAAFIDGKQPPKKVKICALPDVMDDLKAIKSKYGSYFDYYERCGLISPVTLEGETPLNIKDFEIIPVPVKNLGVASTVFVIKTNGKKVAYAPCDTKPLPVNDVLKNLDVLIIGGILPDGGLKDGYTIPEDNELMKEVLTMDELTEIITKLGAKRTVAVHIEEEFGRSYDDYEEIKEQYKEYNIEFAFDGMRIEL
ncbi:MAG: hypothetical protein AYK19_13095 [Theionarchaea archaeon DG-70-1]|nr:MAG: hypothetical protein AYK19_13095 [Theionarchaea archaeon DG-70-1]